MFIFQARDCVSDCSGVSELGVLGHGLGGHIVDDSGGSCNILRNTLVNHDRSPCRQYIQPEITDLSDKETVRLELLSSVRQMNDRLHMRHSNSDKDEYYKSEWRMVALVLDRLLLIVFFIMTVFICVAIFVNVPH